MPDAMLAGLPRLVRVADEVRARGQAMLSVGVAVAVYWVGLWLLDLPVEPARTGVSVLVAALPTGFVAAMGGGRRLARGRQELRAPPRLAVYETLADGRERRARVAGILLLAAVVLLVFDRVTGGGGTMAGLSVGFFAAIGLMDLLEARRWSEIERTRKVRLYTLVRPHAMFAPYGQMEIFEVPRAERPQGEPVGAAGLDP